MTRKQRGETYDVSSARGRAAFEALLDREEDEDGAADRPQQPPRGARKPEQQREKRGKERFFKLKDGGGGGGSGGAQQQQHDQEQTAAGDLAALQDVLPSLPPALVRDVYEGCGGRLEAALDALLAMAGGGGGGDASGSGSNPAGGSGSTRHGTAAAAAPGDAATGQASGISWSDLPPDVVYSILSRLAPPELARLAPASRELHASVRRLQTVSRVLRLPGGLQFASASAMVRAHPRAATVDVSRSLHRPGHWTATTLGRTASKDADPSARRLRAAALEEQEAQLFQLLLAVAEGGGARRLRRLAAAGRGSGASGACDEVEWVVPVSGMVARGLEAMNDRVLAEALGAIDTLR
jgi:hypothetical protein